MPIDINCRGQIFPLKRISSFLTLVCNVYPVKHTNAISTCSVWHLEVEFLHNSQWHSHPLPVAARSEQRLNGLLLLPHEEASDRAHHHLRHQHPVIRKIHKYTFMVGMCNSDQVLGHDSHEKFWLVIAALWAAP